MDGTIVAGARARPPGRRAQVLALAACSLSNHALVICAPCWTTLGGSAEHVHRPVRQGVPCDAHQRGRPRLHRDRPQLQQRNPARQRRPPRTRHHATDMPPMPPSTWRRSAPVARPLPSTTATDPWPGARAGCTPTSAEFLVSSRLSRQAGTWSAHHGGGVIPKAASGSARWVVLSCSGSRCRR
jgi:hypothetical protein